MLTTKDRGPLGGLFRSAARRRRLLSPAFGRAAGALVAVCVGLIALLGVLFGHQNQPGPLDASVDGWIRSSLGGHRGALSVLTGLGSPVPVTVMTSAVVLACLVTRRVRGAVLAATAVPAAAGVTEFVIKPLVDRRSIYDTLTFPSGHTTGISALVSILVVLLVGPLHPPLPARVRTALACFAAVLAAAVAISLVGLSKHYFTDTVGGAAVGVSVVLVTALIFDRLASRPEARTDGPPSPRNSL
jgi:membrane-associated phospholipid phosphatase